MVLTMRVRFLSCIILSACHGFLLTNKTGTHSVGTNGLTDGHYIILTDALSVQKQLLTQMETFVLQLRNEVKTLNQEVKDLTSEKSVAVAALKNVSAAQLLAVATLQNGSVAQSLAVSGLKNETSELRDKSAQLQNNYDSLRKKFDTLQNENGVLKHDNVALKSQISEWNNFSVHIKQELNSFTHSIAASNIQNVTAIQSGMDTLTSKVQSLNSQLNSLSSISTSRSQDFLALLDKTNIADLKWKSIDNWSKSFQNYTDIQLVHLQSHANSSNLRLDSVEQNYAIDGNSTKNRFHSLEQSYASMSSDISTLKGKVQDMSKPVAFTSCAVGTTYLDGQIMKFSNTITSIGINNVAAFKTSGKFTCEQSGVYLFAVFIAYHGSSDADFSLYKNDQLLTRVKIVLGTHSDNYFSGSGTVVVQLNVGDVLISKAYRNMAIHKDSCFTVLKIN